MYTLFLVIIPYTVQYSNYSHGTYIVLGVISNLERTGSIQEDVCGLYANTSPFYIKDKASMDLATHGGGGPRSSLPSTVLP